MTIDFYYSPGSAPCRSVLLVAKAIGVELNLKMVDLKRKEHLTPEFVKLNPQHTVPTIVDDGFALWESHAIITYLVRKYGKDDLLYPKNPKKRAIVDQRLYFDKETLYSRFADCYYPMIFGGPTSPDPGSLANAKNAFKILNTFLEGQRFVTGDTLTVADLTLVATVSSFDIMNFDLAPYKNVIRWYTQVKITTPGYDELNKKNILIFKQWIDTLLNKRIDQKK